jgi:hypothetical protein
LLFSTAEEDKRTQHGYEFGTSGVLRHVSEDKSERKNLTETEEIVNIW